jgi:hypothetical protein
VILGNPTPEFMRLRATTRLDSESFNAWSHRNSDRVNQLADMTEADGEQAAPVIRAQYIYENWARDVARIRAGTGWVRAVLTAVLALSAIGCTTLRTPTQTPDNFPSAALEGAYQVASGLDYATTVNIARRPDCYRETGFPTSGILGAHPSTGSVEAYWAVASVAHFAVSRWLDWEIDATDSDAWRAARIVWHVATIAVSVRADVDNYKIGLRPFGAGAAPQCERLP